LCFWFFIEQKSSRKNAKTVAQVRKLLKTILVIQKDYWMGVSVTKENETKKSERLGNRSD